MTVFEMHLLFNQRYQEIASNKRDTLFPEEIDLLLNTAQDMEVESLVSPLDDTQLRLKGLNALVMRNEPLEVYIPPSSFSFYEPNMVYSMLPAGLKYLINTQTEILRSTVSCDTAPTLNTKTLSEYVNNVSFINYTATENTYYPGLTIDKTLPSPSTIYTAASPYSAGFPDVDSKFLLINNIFYTFLKDRTLEGVRLNVYWERYRDVYYPDSFVFVSPSSFGTITISDTNTTYDSSGTTTQSNYTSYDRSLISSLSNVVSEIIAAKPVELDDINRSKNLNSYYSTSKSEPLVYQHADYLMAYSDESFLITRIHIDYIRKPRPIVLALNQSCELDSSVHRKVVDLAVELARLDTKDKSWQATVQHTENRNKV